MISSMLRMRTEPSRLSLQDIASLAASCVTGAKIAKMVPMRMLF